MAKKNTYDVTKTGPLTYRQLQEENSPSSASVNSPFYSVLRDTHRKAFVPSSEFIYEGPEKSPLIEAGSYLGESMFDPDYISEVDYARMQENPEELRAENQPWYSKLGAGAAKGVLTFGTTFLNGTLGLIAGIGQGIYNLADDDESTGFLQGIWDNDVNKTMQAVSDWSEKALPNYYTDEEKNEPWYTNIFTANFLGDKFLKNIGFTVGAFYSGGLYSKALSAIGGASKLAGATRALTASGIAATNEGSIEALNETESWYNLNAQILDDDRNTQLAKLQDSYKPRIQAILDEYENTKGTLVTSPDGRSMYDPAVRKRDEALAALQKEYQTAKTTVDRNYEAGMAKLNEDRAKMGNKILGMNMAILTASNLFQFGKLFANGFKTANRTSKIVKAADGTYKAEKSAIEPWVKGIGRSLSEGTEEISQKAASEVAGNYYGTDVMNYYKKAKDPDAEQETLSWINSFSEGIEKTVGEGSSWEEFFIGTLTGALGMPVFGKANTQQAYLGKGKSVGMAGGMFDAFSEYRERVQRDTEIANALNERVQDPKFKEYYQGMIRHYKLQKEMDKATDSGDEFEFKNHEHSQMVNDIAMWDNAGKIEDLIEMINDAADTSPENIQEIIRETTSNLQSNPEYQKNIDKINKKIGKLEEKLDELGGQLSETSEDDANYEKLINEVNKINEQIDKEEAKLKEAETKRNLFVGAFVDERGNPYSQEDIVNKIESNKKDILDTIELYRKTKQDIDSSTNYALNSEQLALLTWMKAHKENWDNRASTMAGEIKQSAVPLILKAVQKEIDDFNKELNNMPEILKEENRKKAEEINKDVKTLMDIKETLTKLQAMDNADVARTLALAPQVGSLLKLSMARPDISQQITGNTWELIKKVDDVAKATNASLQYQQKLMEYMLNPQALNKDMEEADKEAVSEYIKKQTEQIKKDIVDNVKTVPQMREALQGLGDDHDAVVKQLTKDENEDIAKLATAYQQITALQRIAEKEFAKPPRNEMEATGNNAAMQTFDAVVNEANSIEDVINKLKEQIDDANNATENVGHEAIVANKLQEILDSYEDAKSAKKTESKDKESKKKAKEDDNAGWFKKGMKRAKEKAGEVLNKAKEKLKGKEDKEEETKDKDKEKDKVKKKLDLRVLNSLPIDEAIEYLEKLDVDDFSAAEVAKLNNLLQKMKEKKDNPSVHNSSDEESSNAEDNSTEKSSDPHFRSWRWGKYDFVSLNDRAKREAVYNTHDKTQDQLAAMDELGAFDFVDNGGLGRLVKAEPNLKITYIKAKDKRLSDSILLAVEMTKERIRKAKPVRLITGSDGKSYQVVGVLGYASADDAAKDNWQEVNKAIMKERGKARPEYFVSENFYNKVKHIYSGRMVKSGTVVSKDGTVTGKVEDRSLKQMLHGVTPLLGVYYNEARGLEVPALPNGADKVPLNINNRNPREGSVWLMVQEADGRYYAKAIKVRRFNTEEYNIDEHKDSPILQQIIHDLEVICNPEADVLDRYSAKYDLQEHLLYFPEYINILFNEDIVSISGVEWGNDIGKGLSPEEKAQKILENLQDEDLNLRFQIDVSKLDDKDYVQELLDSDVMTSDLLQAHNVNASFDLYLNDNETGEPIESNQANEDSNVGHTGNRGVNIALSGNTVNIGRTEYTLLSDGRVMKKNQEVTDPKIVAQVKVINNIDEGKVNPIENTNVYLGVYDDGTEFGVKKTATSHSIVEGDKLEAAKEKSKKLTEKKKQKATIKKVAKVIEEGKEDGLSTEELRKKAGKTIFGIEDEDEDTDSVTETLSTEEDDLSTESLRNRAGRSIFSGVVSSDEVEEEPAPKTTAKPRRKGPPIIGREFKEIPVRDTAVTLESLSRKRANIARIFGLTKDGKQMFTKLTDFYDYVRDPKNGLSDIINTQEDFDSLLNTIENCR